MAKKPKTAASAKQSKPAAAPPAPPPPLTPFQQRLASIAENAICDYEAFVADDKKANESLYEALDSTYNLYHEGLSNPQEYREFLQTKLGTLPDSTTLSPFVFPIKVVFGNNDNSAHRARYKWALTQAHATFTADPANGYTFGKVVELINKTEGKIVGLATLAKAADKLAKGKPTHNGYTPAEAVKQNQTIETFSITTGTPGLRMFLADVDEYGVAKILEEWNEADSEPAIIAADKKRYTRTTPIPYVGGKHRQLRVIDPLLPKTFKEYREPFIGGGAMFLFMLKAHRGQNIQYWINDLKPELYKFWMQIKADPKPFIREARMLFELADGDKDKADIIKKSLQPVRLDDDHLVASVAYFISIVWSYGNKDDPNSTIKNQISKQPDDLFRRIEEAHELMAGAKIKITNLDFRDVLNAPPADGLGNDDVFAFLDPPYDDQDQLYACKLAADPANDNLSKKEIKDALRKGHWDLAMEVTKQPYRWFLTHSSTDFFFQRASIIKCSINNHFEAYEHEVMSSMTNSVHREMMMFNYKPEPSSATVRWEQAKVDAIYEAEIERALNDWREIKEGIVAGTLDIPVPAAVARQLAAQERQKQSKPKTT